MTLEDDIVSSLYDRMIYMVTGKDPSVKNMPSAFDSSKTVLLMAPRGEVLNVADFMNAYTPGNPNGDINHTENIADLMDFVPDSSLVNKGNWGVTGTKISNIYKQMVNLVHVDEPAPSPEIQAARDRLNAILFEKSVDDEGRPTIKPTQLADQEQQAFSNYQDAYTAYIGTWASAQQDPNLKRIWPMTGPTALMQVTRAYANWGAAGRDQIASAKAQLATLNEGQVARCFADAQAKLKAFELVVEAQTDPFYRTKIMPDFWSDDDNSWAHYEFSSYDFASSHSAESTAWSASAGLNLGLWSFGGGAGSSSSHEHMSQNSKNIGIKFKYKICTIYRPWIDATLFGLPKWDLGTYANPGGISGGSNPLMPLYPIAFIVVRDVMITGNWDKVDSDNIASAIHGSVSAGWGPFSVSGSYSHTSTHSTFSAKAVTGGFIIPYPQIIAFVCSKVPYCPPANS